MAEPLLCTANWSKKTITLMMIRFLITGGITWERPGRKSVMFNKNYWLQVNVLRKARSHFQYEVYAETYPPVEQQKSGIFLKAGSGRGPGLQDCNSHILFFLPIFPTVWLPVYLTYQRGVDPIQSNRACHGFQ